jgi:hypothetical protein
VHAVVRNCTGAGAKQLFDALERHKAGVETTLRKVSGLASYTPLRSGDGGMSVTLCKDKAGVDESLKVARERIKKNASNIQASPPAVTEGSVIIRIKRFRPCRRGAPQHRRCGHCCHRPSVRLASTASPPPRQMAAAQRLDGLSRVRFRRSTGSRGSRVGHDRGQGSRSLRQYLTLRRDHVPPGLQQSNDPSPAGSNTAPTREL